MDKLLLHRIISWILIIIVAITILWYVFGNSPNFEQSLLIFIVGSLGKLWQSFYDLKYNTMFSFKKMKEDLELIKNEIIKK